MSKVVIFSYLFWFVLTIIFITGTTRISIFCMGYLVACFYFLLFGGDLLLKPIRSILRYWDWLIAYNIFVITMKNILSVGPQALRAWVCAGQHPPHASRACLAETVTRCCKRRVPMTVHGPFCLITQILVHRVKE